jgi:uncharacterized membrane protein YfcA
MAIMTRQRWFDGRAIASSALCLVPTLALFLTIPERCHLGVFLVAVPTSAAAMWMGYRRHRRQTPALLAMAGLSFPAAGLFVGPSDRAETLLTVPGSVLLAAGHVQKWRGLHHGRSWFME